MLLWNGLTRFLCALRECGFLGSGSTHLPELQLKKYMETPHWFNRNRVLANLRIASAVTLMSAAAAMAFVAVRPSAAAAPRYDINTLAGKVASLRGTAGLQIRFSAFLEQEAEEPEGNPNPPTAITPIHVLSSPLDGTTI